MKRILFLRHSIKDGPDGRTLGPRGYERARATGRAFRETRFSAYFVSTLWRTTQTLAAMAEGAGNFLLCDTPPVSRLHLLNAGHPDILTLWRGPCHAAEEAGEDMFIAARSVQPDLAEKVVALGADAIRSMLNDLKPETTALCIDHSPMIELAASGLGGKIDEHLEPCEGILIAMNEQEEYACTLIQEPWNTKLPAL